MLDTNICIYVLKHHSDKLRSKFKEIGNPFISSVTYAELCFGIENGVPSMQKKRWDQLSLFTQKCRIEAWDKEAAFHYGQIRAFLKKKGTPIGNNDLLIAAHARCLNLILVTNNLREFKRVPGLSLENWLELS